MSQSDAELSAFSRQMAEAVVRIHAPKVADFQRAVGASLAANLAATTIPNIAPQWTATLEPLRSKLLMQRIAVELSTAPMRDTMARLTRVLNSSFALTSIQADRILAIQAALATAQVLRVAPGEADPETAMGSTEFDPRSPARRYDGWGISPEHAEKIRAALVPVMLGTIGVDQAIDSVSEGTIDGPLRLWWSLILTLCCLCLWVAVQQPKDPNDS